MPATPSPRSCPGFFGISVTNLTSGRLVDGLSRSGIDMDIKDLNLEPKINAIMREFLDFEVIELWCLTGFFLIFFDHFNLFANGGEEFEEDPQEDPEEEMEEWDDMDIIEEEEEDPEEDPEEWDDVEAVEQVDEILISHPSQKPNACTHSSQRVVSGIEVMTLLIPMRAQDVSPLPKEHLRKKFVVKWKIRLRKRKKEKDRLGWYDMDERSNDAIDVLKTYGITQPPGLQDPSNDPYFALPPLLIMPPLRRLGASRTRGSRRAAMERMIADRVAQAIEDHEKKRASSSNTEGSSSSGWILDKVVYAASTFEGRALTWWNGNVRTLGLENANKIPWTEFKEMMTTEYCPDTEIQKMEQELWNLTLKGDDIETYINSDFMN
ncbi:putative reverse transcriptase domain-containing protein [Tanacetum coccineum]